MIDLDCGFTVILMGERGVGKSTLAARFSMNEFYTYMRLKYSCSLLINVMEIHQMPAGTIGTINGPVSTSYQGAVGAILIYDVTQRFSFEQVKLLVPILRQYNQTDPYFQIVVVGNKTDLCSKGLHSIVSLSILDYRKKEVSTDELKSFTTSLGVYYWETSAIRNTNISDSVFSFFFERIYTGRIVNRMPIGVRSHVGSIMPSKQYDGEKAGAGNISHYDYLFKVLVAGPSYVGKSNLISRFMKNMINLNYMPTIGYEMSIGSLIVDGKVILAQVCDIAGQVRYKPSVLASSGYNVGNLLEGVSGVMYVYDVTSSFSYEVAKKTGISGARHVHGPDIPIMLVGNKADPYSGQQRQVLREYAENFAKTESVCFTETSAWDPNIKFQDSALFKFFTEIYCTNKEKSTKKMDLDKAPSTSQDGSNLASQFEGMSISNRAPETAPSSQILGQEDRNDQASLTKTVSSTIQGIGAMGGGEVNMNNAENSINFGSIQNNNFSLGRKYKVMIIESSED